MPEIKGAIILTTEMIEVPEGVTDFGMKIIDEKSEDKPTEKKEK